MSDLMTALELSIHLREFPINDKATEAQVNALTQAEAFFHALSSPGSMLELPKGMKVTDFPAADRGPGQITDEQLRDWFTYHSPKDHPNPNVDLVFQIIRLSGFEMARVIRDHCPPCADVTAAIRHIRESVMWANAAVALQVPEAQRKRERLTEVETR